MTSNLCSLQDALDGLCSGRAIQSGEHIKPLRYYCAARLVLEGGFRPEWVNPNLSLSSQPVDNHVHRLKFDSEVRARKETRVLGGIKYKDVDVTVVVPTIGPH